MVKVDNLYLPLCASTSTRPLRFLGCLGQTASRSNKSLPHWYQSGEKQS